MQKQKKEEGSNFGVRVLIKHRTDKREELKQWTYCHCLEGKTNRAPSKGHKPIKKWLKSSSVVDIGHGRIRTWPTHINLSALDLELICQNRNEK